VRRARRCLIAVFSALAGCFVALGPPAAGGTTSAGAPLQVSAAWLTQQGQQLQWRVELAQPFSPGALARDGRRLCLLIERAANGSVSGQVCVIGPGRHSRTPRLTYAPVARDVAGPARVIEATVTRSSARELTAGFLPTEVGVSYAPLRWQVISTLAAPGCLAPASSPARCVVEFPSAPALLRLHEPRLSGCVASGPTWVFHGPSDAREIALTFDDGPWYDTGQFLDLLEREHVVATFFQIGDQISEYARHGLDRRMLRDGDMIGDHTWNYGGDVAAGGRDAVVQISEAAAAIRRATGGFQPCLFRAPGGNVTPALLRTARSLGYTTIQWDIDPRDWTNPGTAEIYDNVVTNAHDGAIVIQHDGGGNRSETLAALPLEIRTLRRTGYRFVTVTQLLGYPLLYR
jgi:peptidoglycan/xylan/chitin deacetylase (PgdA/CDA1 family)